MFAALEDALVEVDDLRHAEVWVVARDVVLTVLKRSSRVSSPVSLLPAERVVDKKRPCLGRLRMVSTIAKIVRGLESVPAMKQRSSPYHRDFTPVSVTLKDRSQQG